MSPRRGTVLIVVAALSALLVSLSLTFLTRVRADVEESELQLQLAQARVMLVAACQYLQESSRIGWDIAAGSRGTADLPPNAAAGTEHAEAFGWIDVRDGSLGPRLLTNGAVTPTGNQPGDPGGVGEAAFPIGQPQRFDLSVPNIPPCAISLHATYNPVSRDAPDSGRAYLRYPDPQPAAGLNAWSGTTTDPGAGVSNTGYQRWLDGDPTPRQATVGRCWFRIVRESTGAVFTITCGTGATRGFRTWAEVIAADQTALFGNDDTFFQVLQASELRLWYRVEWSPATPVIDMNYLREHEEHAFRVSTPTHVGGNPDNGYSGQLMATNMGGTIQWIQRLRHEPAVW